MNGPHRSPARSDLRTARRLFEQALDRPAEERRRFLERACGPDLALLERVASLLEADSALTRSTVAKSGSPLPELRAGASEAGEPAPRGLDRYEIVRALGRGATATVFLARRIDLPEAPPVAVKMLRQDLPWAETARLRFELERRLLARFDHPNIARFLDSGAEDGRPFVVLEYVEGAPITRYCDARCLGVRARLRLVLTVCRAIAYAHRHLVVHRDIKPSNLLVSSDGVPKVLDFGIAKLLDGSADDTLTEQRFLTPSYASPEQIGGRPVTTASDVYSLGLLLYELVCGARPFERASPAAPLGFQAAEVPPPSERLTALEPAEALVAAAARSSGPAALARQLGGDLDTLVGKALRVEPEERYASMELLAEDLERFLENLPIRARKPSWPYRFGKWIRRNRLASAGLTTSTLLAAMLFVSAILHQSRQAETHAEAERARARAEALSSFLIDTFEAADPRGESGGFLTVKELLEGAAARLEGGRAASETLQAAATEAPTAAELAFRSDMEHTLGTALAHFGELSRAKHLLLSALEHRLATGDPALSTTLAELVTACQGLGLYTEARRFAERAWKLEAGRAESDPAGLARARRQLARALLFEGRHREAEPHARAALELDLELGGRSVMARVDSLLVLALVLADEDRLGEGREHGERALELLEGSDARDTVLGGEVLQALASIARRQGRHEEAVELTEELLESRARWLGKRSPAYAEALHRHALAIGANGSWPQAAGLLEEAVGIFAGLSPPSRRSEIQGLRDLGVVRILTGELERAEAELQRALGLASQLEAAGPLAAEILANLVAVERRRGEVEAALAYLERGLALLPEHAPQDPLAWLKVQAHFAGQLHTLGREQDARDLSSRTLEQARERLGTRHALTRRLEKQIEEGE